MVARFQVPNAEVISLIHKGDRVKAIKVWQGQDHRLTNGVRVRPRLQRCMDMIRCVVMGFSDFPMCIPVDGYTIKTNQEEASG